MKRTVRTGPKRRRWRRRDIKGNHRSRHIGGISNDPYPYSPRRCLKSRHRHCEVIQPQTNELFDDDPDATDEALLAAYVDEQEEAYSPYDYLDEMMEYELDRWYEEYLIVDDDPYYPLTEEDYYTP